MLETHRTDGAILETLCRMKRGGTVEEIHAELMRSAVDAISADSVKRHLPGLLSLGVIERDAEIRNDRPVIIFRKSGECFSKAENA